MKRSTSKILTTHTGSLPRSLELQDLLREREEGRAPDTAAFDGQVRQEVSYVIQRQTGAGVDVINDGEQGKAQYATYIKERLAGFEGEREVRRRPRLDDADFLEFAETQTHLSSRNMPQPACTGPISWKDWPAVQKDIDTLKQASSPTSCPTSTTPAKRHTFTRWPM
jgi:5-methyltetrahydropteroyltriglutamate--homocysteine methyltransferase